MVPIGVILLHIYRLTQLYMSGMLGAKQLWKIKAPSEYKFLWLALQEDRCWINDRFHRHGISSATTCALCLQQDEDIDRRLCLQPGGLAWKMRLGTPCSGGWRSNGRMVDAGTMKKRKSLHYCRCSPLKRGCCTLFDLDTCRYFGNGSKC
jgi:hypothetical protein